MDLLGISLVYCRLSLRSTYCASEISEHVLTVVGALFVLPAHVKQTDSFDGIVEIAVTRPSGKSVGTEASVEGGRCPVSI
jgi:hypothetical protein